MLAIPQEVKRKGPHKTILENVLVSHKLGNGGRFWQSALPGRRDDFILLLNNVLFVGRLWYGFIRVIIL